ncbi:MAG TPA: lactonase family protein [Stellaceae bacterium]|nr:lactonase family protein [Stellaceae bacterium]
MAATPQTAVYVSNAGSKEIFVFAMDRDSGELTPIEHVAVLGTDKPSPTSIPMAVSPNRRFLYAALRSEPFPASAFAIDPESGRLTDLGATALADSMAYVATDRTGHFLLSASYPGAKLAINPIDGSGRLGERPTQVLPTQPKAHCVVVDGSNRFAYCTCLGGDIIMQLRFDASTGTVTPNEPASISTKPNAGPRHLAFHPNGRFLYLLNETDATLGIYAVDPATGTLAEVQTVPTLPPDFSGKPSAADLHVTPDGRFIYASERTTSTIKGFRIDPERGTFSRCGRWPTETTPRGFAIDPRGRFLLAAGLSSNAMTVSAIDPDNGTLAEVRKYPLGEMPNWIEIVDLR